jgi:hypothetical protein
MKLKDFERADLEGHYEKDGIDYDNAESLLQIGFLDFCPCGLPCENLEYIRIGLQLIDKFRKIHHFNDDRVTLTQDSINHDKISHAHFGNEESKFFFWYWADKEEYTAHGGSVPGWLTDKGKEFLALLNQYHDLKGETENGQINLETEEKDSKV